MGGCKGKDGGAFQAQGGTHARGAPAQGGQQAGVGRSRRVHDGRPRVGQGGRQGGEGVGATWRVVSLQREELNQGWRVGLWGDGLGRAVRVARHPTDHPTNPKSLACHPLFAPLASLCCTTQTQGDYRR